MTTGAAGTAAARQLAHKATLGAAVETYDPGMVLHTDTGEIPEPGIEMCNGDDFDSLAAGNSAARASSGDQWGPYEWKLRTWRMFLG